jgi:hypothetical protein
VNWRTRLDAVVVGLQKQSAAVAVLSARGEDFRTTTDKSNEAAGEVLGFRGRLQTPDVVSLVTGTVGRDRGDSLAVTKKEWGNGTVTSFIQCGGCAGSGGMGLEQGAGEALTTTGRDGTGVWEAVPRGGATPGRSYR